jgi:hypothetical protein
MARQYVLWGIPEKKCVRIGMSDVRCPPLPFGAEIITYVEFCDLRIMRRWCERRAKRGWSINRMRQACGEI